MALPDRRRIAAVILMLMIICFLPYRVRAQEADRIGTVLAVEGAVEVRAQNATAWEPLRFRDAIFLNDSVRTADNSKVKVLLRDDSIMTLAERSEMQFTEMSLTPQQRRTAVSLLFGKIRVLTTRIFGAGSTTEVHTPNTVAGVRGSEQNVQHDEAAQKTRVLCVNAGAEDHCYIRDPDDPTKFLNIPEGHLAEQVGVELPTSTRVPTPEERQEITGGTITTAQVPGAVQTAVQLAQSQITQPSTRSDLSTTPTGAQEIAAILPEVSSDVAQAGQLGQLEFRSSTGLTPANQTSGDDQTNNDILPGLGSLPGQGGQESLTFDSPSNPAGTEAVNESNLNLIITLPR